MNRHFAEASLSKFQISEAKLTLNKNQQMTIENGIASNAKRLLWAGFLAIFAAGVGFAIRGGILDNWGRDFGFTAGELGLIGGAGFTGFCFGIIIGGMIVDKIGYGKLVVVAFLLHILSAFVTFGASKGMDKMAAYNFLFWGTFIFAVANGTLEAVANPLVATLFPKNRTHYLNILHASWPGGLVVGGVLGWILDDHYQMSWKVQLGLFLLPTILYGFMFFGQKFPKSEASQSGLGIGEMLKDVGILGGAVACTLLALFFKGTFGLDNSIAIIIGLALLGVVAFATRFSFGAVLLFVLFIVHAMVGTVELGTDGWIQNITGNILTSSEGKILFVFTSLTMFLLRFCAHFIETKLGLKPIGILLICAILGFIGLNMASGITSFSYALLALTVYGISKTFFWPTMLAVASDRFPRTGAVAISIMGGIGMMSAGLFGSPGLGYAKDRFSGEALQKTNPTAFAEYKAEKPTKFLFFADASGLDGKKLGAVQDKLNAARAELAKAGNLDSSAALAKLTPTEKSVHEASIMGDRNTLKADAFIPAIMAAIYLGLLLYFKAIGGYKTVTIGQTKKA